MDDFKYTVSPTPGGIRCLAPGLGEMGITLDTVEPAERDLDLLLCCLICAAGTGARDLVIERTRLLDGTVPALLCYPKEAVKLPLVFFFNGFNNTFKEHVLRQGILLAQAGFFVVLPDARMHGERRPENFAEILSESLIPPVVLREAFIGTAEEISGMIDFFGNDTRVDTTRVGIAGTSFGGMLTFLATSLDKRIRAAVPLIGTPVWGPPDEIPPEMKILSPETKKLIDEYEPLRYPERFYPVALLMQNGTKDFNVPPNGVRALYEKLTPLYTDTPERLKLIEYPVGHEVTPEMEEMMVAWFRRFLKQ